MRWFCVGVLALVVSGCGSAVLRLCSDGCVAPTQCDEPTGLCVSRAEVVDGGSAVLVDGGTSFDAGEKVIDAGHFFDAGQMAALDAGPECTSAQSRPCAGGCNNTQTCTVDGTWGPCHPSCAVGLSCVNDTCTCTNTSCTGCCLNNQCQPGRDPARCGSGGSACQPCPAGETCGTGACSGCNASTCSSGCCSGAECKPRALTACTSPGAACVTCDAQRADTCAASGTCQCGAGAQCMAGQRCVSGACVCDSTSCSTGCCKANQCFEPALVSCGTNAAACVSCDNTRADSCSNGRCMCGSSYACSPGQRCKGGVCLCDSTSCSEGCCTNNLCSGPSFNFCGVNGSICALCDYVLADTCANGQCRCGSSPPCAIGQRCFEGTCVCDSISCQYGCCQSNQCQSTSVSVCGLSGAACVACDEVKNDTCYHGQCSCGLNGSCEPGLRCTGGSCVCDATSGCAGCCSNSNTCHTTFPQCGIDGGVCATCDTRYADQCNSSGQCACGTGAACVAGQRCASGSCVCDESSGCGGCCLGNQCRAKSHETCGVSGRPCKTCETNQECVVGGVCVCTTSSCAAGCCDSNHCVAPPTMSRCGTGGVACFGCDTLRADTCTVGGCMCGVNPPCVSGVTCTGGVCI